MKIFLFVVFLVVLSNATLKEILQEDVKNMQDNIITLAQDLKDGAGHLKDKVVDGAILAEDAAENAAKDAASILEAKLEATKEWLNQEASTASEALKAGGSAIKGKVQQIAETTAEVVHKVKEKIMNEDL
jgi:uncharacterized phage infection (PIP) family protein YhgE